MSPINLQVSPAQASAAQKPQFSANPQDVGTAWDSAEAEPTCARRFELLLGLYVFERYKNGTIHYRYSFPASDGIRNYVAFGVGLKLHASGPLMGASLTFSPLIIKRSLSSLLPFQTGNPAMAGFSVAVLPV